MSGKRPKFLTVRDGVWHFARRVPNELAAHDPRGVIKHSTRVAVADDPDGVRAWKVAEGFNSDLEASWRALAGGEPLDLKERYAAARARARLLGLSYRSPEEIASGALADIVGRLEVLVAREGEGDPVSRDAVFGLAPKPAGAGLLLSGLLDAFEDAVRADIRDFSPNQLRRWRNAKKRAIDNLIGSAGDVDIAALTRDHALEYRTWWQGRILEDGIDPDTANKDFGHLKRMLREIDRLRQLGLPPVFADLRFEGGFGRSRKPYPRAFVQDVILAPGRLMTLNDEARRVVFLIAGTGLRVTECVNLNEKTIRFDSNIPHVQVRPDGRRMKTDESERDVPLAGVALAAMCGQRKGFPRYHDKAAGLSATVNAYLADNKLRPEEGQSLYSLRHTFKDSLIAQEAPDSMIDALMGHADDGPKYGTGPSLELKLKWVERVAFQAPAVV